MIRPLGRMAWRAMEIALVVGLEGFLVLFCAISSLEIGRHFSLSGMSAFAVFFTLQTISVLLLLAILRRVLPLQPGFFSVQKSRGVLLRWRVESFFSRVNLLPFHPVAYVPSIFRKFVVRVLGADVGGGLMSLAGPIWVPSLIRLGDEVLLGQEAELRPHSESAEGLFLGRIVIGHRVVIGARSVVEGDVEIGDDAMVKAMSVIPRGTRIGPGEVWAGVPAKRVGIQPARERSANFMSSRDILVKSGLQGVLLVLAAFSTWGLNQWASFSFWTVALVYFLFLMGWSLVAMNAIRWIVSLPPGIHSRDSSTGFCWSVYAYIGIVDLFLPYQMGALPACGRKLLARVLGARFGPRTIFRGYMFDSFLVTVEEGAKLERGTYLLPHAISNDAIVLKPIRIGRDARVGEYSVLMPGVVLGEGAQIHPYSLVPMDTVVPPRETWGGVPARKTNYSLLPLNNK